MMYFPRIPQMILGIIASVVLGWVSYTYLSAVSFKLFLAVCICLSIGLLFVIQYRQSYWKSLTLQHFLLSMMLATSFLGSALFTVSAGPITLFPYRVILVVLAAFLFFKVVRKDISLSGHFQIPFVYLFLLIWILYGFLALSWSADLTSGLKEMITLTTEIMVIFFVTILFKREENYFEFFTLWIVMGFLLIGIGFVEHFLHHHLPVSRIYTAFAYQQGIPTAVYENENDYGSFLGLLSFFYLSLAKNGKVVIYRLVGIFGFLSAVYLIIVTQSRANYIGVFLGCIVWFIVFLSRKQKLASVWSAIILIPVVAAYDLKKIRSFGSFLSKQFSSITSGDVTSSVPVREHLLANAKVFIENSFGFGVGPGNIEYYQKNYPVYETFGAYNPHNWWFEIFSQYGFLIITGYILMFLFLFVALFRVWKRQKNVLISEALICGMVAFIMASISPNSFIGLNYNWVFMAFVIAYVNYHYKEIKHSGGQK
jgi:teichuronic acid biosynthesis protein TuaE